MSLESIPTEKLIEGVKKSLANAQSFLDEVFILKEKEKWVHAYSLCQFATEELAKTTILLHLWIGRINETTLDYKKLDSDFVSHIEKTKLSIKTEMALFQLYKDETGFDWVDNIVKKGEEYINDIKHLNDLKNESLYVTVKNSDFQSPSEVITKEIFDKIYGTALLRKMISENIINGYEKHINEVAKLVKENNIDIDNDR